MLREAQTSQEIDTNLLGTDFLSLNDNTRQVGGNALWSWRMTPRTSANMSAGYTRTTSMTTGRQDNIKTFRVGLARKFQPKLSGTVDLRHNQRDSNLSGNDYRENAITASLLMSF
jgi:uncharacterized protein (PEP-CTERM system associated)